jgi:phosphohistidine swiveling domain-containing protein
MTDTTMRDRPTPWVRPLADVGRDDLATAGGKGANLGELVRAGVRVPPGFVVTTDAHAAAAGDGPVPPDVAEAIRSAYADLGRGPVAVRSSATAEDLPGAAFAGQQDTYLDIEGEADLLDAVRRCWASLWSERAVAYRERRGIGQAGVRMAVVVQRMVPAEVAGVAFTANPVTGARTEVVVDAGLGLGEAVVSGTVTADHLVVDRRAEGSPELSGPALSRLGAAGVADLVAVAQRIERHFGRPQDIEWAYADRTLWIVQARPMTALPPPPLPLNRLQRIYTSMFAELMPIRPYPLDVTTWTSRGHGRILVRMAAELPGLRVDLTQMLPEVDGVVDRLEAVRFRPTRRTPGTPLRMLRAAARFPVGQWTRDPRFAAFERDVAELRAVDVTRLGWADLLNRPERALATLDRFVDLRIDYLPSVALSIVRLRVLLTILGLGAAYGGLVRGLHTRTEDANRALRALAERVAAEGRSAGVQAALEQYLAEFGHREISSAFLASQPTWGEDPDLVLEAAEAVLGRPGPPRSAPDEALARVLGRQRVRLLHLGPRIVAAATAARQGLAFREDTHFHVVGLLPIVRGALLEAGGRLARARVLDHPGDIWHLRWPEVTGIADPEQLAPEDRARLRAAVADRSARREAYGGAPLISPASLRPRGDRAGALLVGHPASAGQASGPVRVVRGPEDFGRLRPGEILVCPFTNPAWTPLFEIAAAAVVDTGSVGSHAAITAREYGIPAVMGTGTGTAVLVDGQLVEVDGSAGTVRAVEAADHG